MYALIEIYNPLCFVLFQIITKSCTNYFNNEPTDCEIVLGTVINNFQFSGFFNGKIISNNIYNK